MKKMLKTLSVAVLLTTITQAHGMFRTFAGLRGFSRPMMRAAVFGAAAGTVGTLEARINVQGKGTFQENSKFKAERQEATRKQIARFATSAHAYAQCVKQENNAYNKARNPQEFEKLTAAYAPQCDPFKKEVLIDPIHWRYDRLGATPFMSDLHARTSEKFYPWNYTIEKLDLDIQPKNSKNAQAEFTFQASVTQKTLPGLAAHLYKMKQFNKEYAQCIKNGTAHQTERCQALDAIYPSPQVTFQEFEIDVDLKESNEAV